MSLTLTQIKSHFKAGEAEPAFLTKLQASSKETFALKKEDGGSPVAYADTTKKYLGSKGSKLVTYIDKRTNKIHGVATTAESL
jgi:hypothetical protein